MLRFLHLVIETAPSIDSHIVGKSARPYPICFRHNLCGVHNHRTMGKSLVCHRTRSRQLGVTVKNPGNKRVRATALAIEVIPDWNGANNLVTIDTPEPTRICLDCKSRTTIG